MYHEIASQHTAKTAIEDALQKTFSTTISIQTMLVKIEPSPIQQSSPSVAISAEEAAELLGGDIIAE